MAATSYPTVCNCNYESSDDSTIHEARLALDRGLTSDEALSDAMEALEAVLTDELSESGEYQHGAESEQAIDEAEGAVRRAWTEAVQAEVKAERERPYR